MLLASINSEVNPVDRAHQSIADSKELIAEVETLLTHGLANPTLLFQKRRVFHHQTQFTLR
jgi:hypothetical protein